MVIDEIHTLVNTKRGDLLSLNLSRINSISPDCKKIGLSATVKNKNAVLKFLTSKKKAKTLNVEETSVPKIDILETNNRVPWSGHMASYAIRDIYHKIKKSSLTIVFVNTRAQAELVFNKLWQENENNLRKVLPWMKEYTSRQIAPKLFREDTGIALASRSSIWRKGKRIGKKVKLIQNDFPFSEVDIHDKNDLKIAEEAMKLLRKNKKINQII